jgi:TonB family protein
MSRLFSQRMLTPVLILMFLTIGSVTARTNNMATAMTIYGHITDESGEPLKGVVQTVKWTEREIRSDLHGAFTIENVAERDTITIHHQGFQSTEFPVVKSKVNYIIHLKKEDTSPKTNSGNAVNITGVITNSQGYPVSDAVLISKGTNRGTTTNSLGEFSLKEIPVASTVMVTHVSFLPNEFVVSKSKTHFELTLQNSITQLDEIVVTGYGNNGHPIRNISTPTSENQFVAVEQNPEFPGGTQALYKYLADNISYPTKASQANQSGKVFISFSINEEGKVRRPQIVKSMGWGIDEEVLRVILNMPPWKPAMQNGNAVTKDYTLAIVFSLL